MSTLINSSTGQKNLHGHPDECPFCHNKITPLNVYSFLNQVSGFLDVLQHCPNQKCFKSFIAYYKHSTGSSYSYANQTTQGVLIGKEFSQTIKEISESFVLIYNQAYSAEQQNLDEICGVGYRKALEFLIKDYVVKNFPDKIEIIQKKLLGPCISEFVSDARIKSVAKRAVWLGNDETHYIRKWEGKNLEDLKKLIDLTIHWIEMETLTQSFEDEMPD